MNPTTFVSTFLRFFLYACEALVLGRVLISFVDPQGRSKVGAFLIQITEPVLGPIRRMLPSTGAFDFSPLIVLIAISVIGRVLGVL